MAAVYSRGVVSSIGSASMGLLQSVTFDEAADTEEALDANGDVLAFEDFNRKVDGTMEVVYNTNSSVPTTGSTVTVAGSLNSAWNGNYACRKVSMKEDNRGYKRVTITAQRYLTNSGTVTYDATSFTTTT